MDEITCVACACNTFNKIYYTDYKLFGTCVYCKTVNKLYEE